MTNRRDFLKAGAAAGALALAAPALTRAEALAQRIAPTRDLPAMDPAVKELLTDRHSAVAVFRFGSNQNGVAFYCRIDGGPFRPCPERLMRQFTSGPHSLRVIASNAAGSRDRSPAVYRFTVRRVR